MLSATLLHGWGFAALVGALTTVIGDLALRQLLVRAAFGTLAHLVFGAAISGLLYDTVGGVSGAGALATANLGPIVILGVALPVVINGTFYVELALRGMFEWRDARLTLRWEAVVYAASVAFALGWVAIAVSEAPVGPAAALSAILLGAFALTYWIVSRAVRADEFRLVQGLAGAVAAEVGIEVLQEYREQHPAFQFMLLGTDISKKVLERAVRAIYSEERVETVPQTLKKKYLLRSKDPKSRLVRIVPGLRAQVRFRRLNFMDGDFGMREPMDIIFCRNVIIYFDKPTQEKLVNRLCSHLIPGGYLFMGHSETLSGLKVPLVSVGHMVYRKPL